MWDQLRELPLDRFVLLVLLAILAVHLAIFFLAAVVDRWQQTHPIRRRRRSPAKNQGQGEKD